jgi:hypothetical protein
MRIAAYEKRSDVSTAITGILSVLFAAYVRLGAAA